MPTMNATNGKGLTWPTSRMAKFIDVTPRRDQMRTTARQLQHDYGNGQFPYA
jgi:hypothetical protein